MEPIIKFFPLLALFTSRLRLRFRLFLPTCEIGSLPLEFFEVLYKLFVPRKKKEGFAPRNAEIDHLLHTNFVAHDIADKVDGSHVNAKAPLVQIKPQPELSLLLEISFCLLNLTPLLDEGDKNNHESPTREKRVEGTKAIAELPAAHKIPVEGTPD
jgi:hypothetical protein